MLEIVQPSHRKRGPVAKRRLENARSPEPLETDPLEERTTLQPNWHSSKLDLPLWTLVL
jgi:hypothetical protein